MSKNWARVLILCATALTIFAGVSGGHWGVILLVLPAGAVWLLNTLTDRYFWSTFAFLGQLAGSTLLVFWEQEWTGLIAVTMVLAAWDLDAFGRRLARFDQVEGDIEKAHVQRVGLIGTIGLVLGSLPLVWQFDLSLGWALLVAGILVISLILVLRGAGHAAG
jgi:hypothetical protein